MKATRPARRPAFTLVEMLVVILIMSILVTLVTLGVTRAMRYASEVGTKTEMAQIEQALGVAALDLGRVPYIPSYLVLKPTPGGYITSDPWEAMSLRLLKQMFPNWTNANWGTQNLNASQAFVFILGGAAGTEGFNATDPDPFKPGGKRKGPYFNFKPERLVGTYQYKDYWGDNILVCYSSQMVASSLSPPFVDRPPSVGTAPQAPDRQFQKANLLFMPKGYQIFSAGKDGKWGTNDIGGVGKYGDIPFNGKLNASSGNGEDDQCNFSESPLGKPIND